MDIEVESDKVLMNEIIMSARTHSTSIIISYHNFEETPALPELEQIVSDCRIAGADVVKIASQVNHTEDLQNLYDAYNRDTRAIGMKIAKTHLEMTKLSTPEEWAVISKPKHRIGGF